MRFRPGPAGIALVRLFGSHKAARSALRTYLCIREGTARNLMHRATLSPKMAKYLLLRADDARAQIERDAQRESDEIELRRQARLDAWAIGKLQLEAFLRGEQLKEPPIPTLSERDEMAGRRRLSPLLWNEDPLAEESDLLATFGLEEGEVEGEANDEIEDLERRL